MRRCLTLLLALSSPLSAQREPGAQGSRNVHVLAHMPVGGSVRVSDLEIEQELARPYVYVSKRYDLAGVDFISIKDPS